MTGPHEAPGGRRRAAVSPGANDAQSPGAATSLTYPQAVAAAANAADAAYANFGPGAFTWLDALSPGMTHQKLAHWTLSHPGAGPRHLYVWAVKGETRAAAWTELPPALQVGLTVFHGAIIALMDLVRATPAAPVVPLNAPQPTLGGRRAEGVSPSAKDRPPSAPSTTLRSFDELKLVALQRADDRITAEIEGGHEPRGGNGYPARKGRR